jgi:hypothetical protein
VGVIVGVRVSFGGLGRGVFVLVWVAVGSGISVGVIVGVSVGSGVSEGKRRANLVGSSPLNATRVALSVAWMDSDRVDWESEVNVDATAPAEKTNAATRR